MRITNYIHKCQDSNLQKDNVSFKLMEELVLQMKATSNRVKLKTKQLVQKHVYFTDLDLRLLKELVLPQVLRLLQLKEELLRVKVVVVLQQVLKALLLLIFLQISWQ